jgi:tricarballylate dehydrogenase
MRELNCDVIVVGCGAAGLTAALAALQNGAKVIVLERSTVEERGGNTRWTEALLRVTLDGDPARDFIRLFTDQAGYHITPEFVQATAADYESWPALSKALPFTDPELLTTFVDGIRRVLEWLRPHGIRTHPCMYPLPPAVAARWPEWPAVYGGGLAIIEALCPEIERLGAQIEYETTAVRLLTDDDERVIGIKATDRNHAGVVIRARGVVLACGGFEGNPEMTVRYMGSEARYLRPVARGGWYNRGEGIRMALEVNAAPAGDYAECHRQPIDPRSNRAESLVFAYPLGVLVNARGQRFIDEAPNHVAGYLEEPLRALSRQPGGIAYFIFDRQIEHVPDWRIMVRSDQPPIEAPSLRELATRVRISPDGLETTITDFNCACPLGPWDASKFDRQCTNALLPAKSNWARPIVEPPFGCFPIIASNTRLLVWSPTEGCDYVQEAAFARRCCTHVDTGHVSYLGDRVVGQIDRRMCLARQPKSLALSDMRRM